MSDFNTSRQTSNFVVNVCELFSVVAESACK